MHRHPIAALAAALTLLCACRDERADAASRVRLADLSATSATASDEPIPLPQCLRSDRGTALMAIVHAPAARATAHPDGGGATTPLNRWMPPYFVFDVEPASARAAAMRGELGEVRALLLGDTAYASSILGWVPASACLLRGHRLCAKLSRGALDVYASAADIAEVLAARDAGRPPRVRPFARTRDGAIDGTPWPIDTVEVAVGERRVQVYRLHFLGSHADEPDVDRSAAAAERAKLSAAELRAVDDALGVQCMVVCDVTGSMDPWWAQVRRFLEQEFATGLLSMGVPVEVGLVLFRDVCDAASSFEVRHRDLQAGVGHLAAELAGVEIGGGGDNPEATLRAITAALERSGWSTSPLTRRLMFVVSDAPSHEDQGISIADVIAKATARGVAIHGLVVGERKGAERELQVRQCRQLGDGTGGGVRTIRDFPMLLDALSADLDAERRQQAETRDVLHAANDGASDAEIAAGRGLSVERVRSILQFLSTAGVEIGDRDEPRLGTGYVLPESADHALEKQILTTSHDVRTVQFLLQCLVQDYDPAKQYGRVGGLIVPALETARVVTDTNQPIDLFCKLRGIPLLRAGESLAITPAQIAAMSAGERAERRSQLVNHILPRLARLLHDRRHWPFESAAGTWGFLPGEGL